MPELLAALDAFLQEHRRCGELDGGVDRERVWLACDCGAGIAHPIKPTELNQPREQRYADRYRSDSHAVGTISPTWGGSAC